MEMDDFLFQKARAQLLEMTSNDRWGVPLLRGEELANLLKQSSRRLVLVDVRTDEEIEVSTINGALSKDEFLKQEEMQEFDKETDIIVPFCTIGYRSGQFASALKKKQGYKWVYNGEGVVLWSHCAELHSAFVVIDKNRKEIVDHRAPAQQALRIHCYGEAWRFAHSNFQTVIFDDVAHTFIGLLRKFASCFI
jgi:rhodanese-related sulfurtransferase